MTPSEAGAELLLRGPGTVALRIAVPMRLFIGRICHGIDDEHRLLLSGEGISRDHCHIVLYPDTLRAVVVDTSTNGTRLNGSRMERSVPVALRSGDRLKIGPYELEFISHTYSAPSGEDLPTQRLVAAGRMALVCGDLVDYTRLSEIHGGSAMFGAMQAIFDDLRVILGVHHGTLYDYVGDALLAGWEHSVFPDAVLRAVTFARAANERVVAIAPHLAIGRPDGTPLCMGWAVTVGQVASSVYAGSLQGLVGDAVNIGFRLAGAARRDDRPAILVTEEAYAEVAGMVPALPPLAINVKGRDAPVMVRPLP